MTAPSSRSPKSLATSETPQKASVPNGTLPLRGYCRGKCDLLLFTICGAGGWAQAGDGKPPNSKGMGVLYSIDSSTQKPPSDLLAKLSKSRRVLLIEANDQRRWVGGLVTPEVHIPPVGLMYVASSAKRHNPDVQIEILETSLDARSDEELVAKLLDYRPDVVGIRSISLFEDELKRVAELTRTFWTSPSWLAAPSPPPGADRFSNPSLQIDLLVVGEGELPFSRLLSGTSTNGLVFRNGSQIVDLGDGDIVDNLDELPFPDYSLVDLSRYQEHLSYAYNHRRQGVLLTSRGCPFLCTYCNTFAGKTARLRSAENVVAEMEQMSREHAIEDFYVVDDIFNMDRKRTAGDLSQDHPPGQRLAAVFRERIAGRHHDARTGRPDGRCGNGLGYLCGGIRKSAHSEAGQEKHAPGARPRRSSTTRRIAAWS